MSLAWPGLWRRARSGWDRLVVYLPVILMGLLAAGTYWLARTTPVAAAASEERPPTHDPDYFMRNFAVRSFDANGRLKSEVFGTEARHYPDTDTVEIDRPRILSYGETGTLTVGTALRGISNGDGTEVQLIGDAVVTRQAVPGQTLRIQFRGEFLHAFLDTEKVRSHKPVTLIRGNDQFTGDVMDYDNLEQVMDLRGRVRGVIQPAAGALAPKAAP